MPAFGELSTAASNKMNAYKRQFRSWCSADTVNIYPSCDGDWQLSTDKNGVAYPAGLKQIRMKHKWNVLDVSLMNGGTYLPDYIVAVPADIPAGYTNTNLRFDTQALHGGVFGQGQRVPTAPVLVSPPGYLYVGGSRFGTFVRTPSTLEAYQWMPENVGNSCWPARDGSGNEIFGNYSGWTDPGTAQGNTRPYGRTAGMRYIRFTFDSTATTATLRVQVRRDATPVEADDFVPGTVVCYDSGSIGPGVFDSGFIYHGDPGVDLYSPTLGTLWNFEVAVEISDGMGGWNYVSPTWLAVHAADMTHIDWHFYAGPRLDIPLPWNVSTDSYMVPGGIVAGAITGY